MKKFGLIGEVLIDKYDNEQKIGGAAFNAACGISRLGNQAFFLGSVSIDVNGLNIKEALIKYNVDTEWLQSTTKATTYSEVTLDDDNERTFKFKRASDAAYDITKFDTKEFEFDWVHFGAATGFLPGKLKASYKFLREWAIKNKVPYSFDPNYREALWKDYDNKEFIDMSKEWIKDASVGKIGDDELMLIYKETELEKAIAKLQSNMKKDSVFAITRGDKSTIVLWNKKRWEVEVSPELEVADTTGAGDAFAASLVSSFGNLSKSLNQDRITEIITKANDAGKKATEYIGALTYLNN